MAEVDARHLVAFRAVAQDAIRAEQPAAFLDVRRGISVLCRSTAGEDDQQERKGNQSHAHCLSKELGTMVSLRAA